MIVHKYLLLLAEKVKRPVSLTRQLIGDVILHIPRDAAVCTALANDCYDPDTGARSLDSGVKIKVEAPLVQEYLAVNETINEGQPTEDYIVEVSPESQIVISRKKDSKSH